MSEPSQSSQPDVVTFKFLNGQSVTTTLPTSGTVREFMLGLVANEVAFADAGPSSDDSFEHAFYLKGVAVNSFDNRHKPVRSLIQPGDVIHTTLWRLGPSQRFKHNGPCVVGQGGLHTNLKGRLLAETVSNTVEICCRSIFHCIQQPETKILRRAPRASAHLGRPSCRAWNRALIKT